MSNNKTSVKKRVYEIIFDANTFEGKLFDILLLIIISLSVVAISLESVPSIKQKYGSILYNLEWLFTILFTIEYFARIYSIDKPKRYIFSFYGVIDLLAILPTYLSLVLTGTAAFVVIRVFRLLRVFRVLKLVRYLGEANSLRRALKLSLPKISVFMVFIICIVMIVGTIMFIVEGEGNGFNSIPKGVYWTIVTMTTVGYGDIAPQTVVGQSIASVVMLLGYAVLAVPTGIVTSKLVDRRNYSDVVCSKCGKKGHSVDAVFCDYCGNKL